MKKEIFVQYLEAVLKLYKIPREEMISNCKNRDAVDARQMLYYLCSQRQITLGNIHKYMTEQGYDPKKPPIINGIKQVQKKVDTDPDYKIVVERIANKIFI